MPFLFYQPILRAGVLAPFQNEPLRRSGARVLHSGIHRFT
jgi:hypothetical protein